MPNADKTLQFRYLCCSLASGKNFHSIWKILCEMNLNQGLLQPTCC